MKCYDVMTKTLKEELACLLELTRKPRISHQLEPFRGLNCKGRDIGEEEYR